MFRNFFLIVAFICACIGLYVAAVGAFLITVAGWIAATLVAYLLVPAVTATAALLNSATPQSPPQPPPAV